VAAGEFCNDSYELPEERVLEFIRAEKAQTTA
jgi:hypothetical protein